MAQLAVRQLDTLAEADQPVVGLDLDAKAAAPGLTADKLAAAMAAPENASMRKSTKRLIADADLLPLAKMTLALA